MAILINLNDARKKLYELEGSAEYNKGVTDSFNALFDLPTIEAEPVKHGKWMPSKDGHGCDCSVCGTLYTWREADTMRYCKRCGALMDEVDE